MSATQKPTTLTTVTHQHALLIQKAHVLGIDISYPAGPRIAVALTGQEQDLPQHFETLDDAETWLDAKAERVAKAMRARAATITEQAREIEGVFS